MTPNELQTTLAVAGVQLRAKLREIRNSDLQIALLVGLPAVIGTGFGMQAYELGQKLAAGQTKAVTRTVRAATITGFLLLVVYSLIGSGARDSFAQQRTALLTAQRHDPSSSGH